MKIANEKDKKNMKKYKPVGIALLIIVLLCAAYSIFCLIVK